ncbi:MAG: hypothetical protein NTW87_13610 [Planctomycetota bacterium]|nr:hypothetical protein [Planctomycetota bacterium]
MFHLRLFLICVCFLDCAALSRAWGGDVDANPTEALVSLAQGPEAPPAAKLKGPFLQLQWLRLTGEAPCPKRAVEQGNGPGALKPAAGLGPLRMAKVQEAHEDRKTTVVGGEPSPPLSADEKARLQAWFDAKPKLRDRFLMAVNAAEDDMPNAARVALALHEKFPKDSEALENLLLAFAVVWDDEVILRFLNAMGVPELISKPVTVCTMEEAFGWYVNNQAKLCPGFKAMPWRLLTYVASDTTLLSEREWILKKYGTCRPNLGTVYSEIEYDMSKIRDGKGKLAGHEYTLANLKQYGGVCRDQAYYARAVCRAFGLPAYMAGGVSNAGGGHFWVGWVLNDGAQGYQLHSHGRYQDQKYFTARIIDPQSGWFILDCFVGIEARGMSEEESYEDADLYYRVSEENAAALPAQARVNLLIAAVRKNPYCRPAWLALGDATAAGDLPRASAEAQWQYLQTKFKEYPDFTFSMLGKFSKIFKTPLEKLNFYEATSRIFQGLRRPDLVAKLRIEEIDMCVAENRKDLAVQVALAAVKESAGEGAEGAALAKRAVELLREMGQPQLAIKPLQDALNMMPKTNYRGPSPHWIMVAELLRDLCKDTGDVKKADALQGEIEHIKKTAVGH